MISNIGFGGIRGAVHRTKFPQNVQYILFRNFCFCFSFFFISVINILRQISNNQEFVDRSVIESSILFDC